MIYIKFIENFAQETQSLFIGLFYVVKAERTRSFIQISNVFKPNWAQGLKPILALGIPTTLALLFEVSLFSMIALFVAPLGAVVIAGHQIAINFTSLAFMLPLSFAMALTVRIGFGYGEKNIEQLRISLITGFTFALVLGVLLALISYFFRMEIVGLYSKDIEVLYLAAYLLLFAAAYQVFDAIQVTTAGALRGLHDSKITMLVTFISYWGIGLGFGYVLAFKDWVVAPMGVQGFWLSIVLGLFLASILLPLRLKKVLSVIFHGNH